MVAVAKAHGAMVLVDEAHAMGFFGEHGRGVTEAAGVEDQVDFVIGTFSKSVGTVGGFCVSNHPKFEVLRLVCRPYVFTASLPPAVVASSAASIRKLMHNGNKRQHLWENTRAMHAGLTARGFTLGTATAESAILAVIMPDQATTLAMWQALLERGVYVNFARPPATPTGVFLLRCSLCAEHTADEIATILQAFDDAAKAIGVALQGGGVGRRTGGRLRPVVDVRRDPGKRFPEPAILSSRSYDIVLGCPVAAPEPLGRGGDTAVRLSHQAGDERWSMP